MQCLFAKRYIVPSVFIQVISSVTFIYLFLLIFAVRFKSKRSSFIQRLDAEVHGVLMKTLMSISESWGERENGFSLADCCRNVSADVSIFIFLIILRYEYNSRSFPEILCYFPSNII